MMFHVVTAGTCWLDVEGAERLPVRQGRPCAGSPRRRSPPGQRRERTVAKRCSTCREIRSAIATRCCRHGGGEPTSVICGLVRFEHPAAEELLRLLPRRIKVDSWSSPEAEWIQSTLRLITAEARELRPGGETVITRLADVLVIQAIRSWLSEDPAAQTGWLGASRDKQIGRAIVAIHRNPGERWTLGVSRQNRRDVALGVCRAIHGARRRAGHALRKPMENAFGRDVAQRKRSSARGPRRQVGLRIGGLVQSSVQTNRRHFAGRRSTASHEFGADGVAGRSRSHRQINRGRIPSGRSAERVIADDRGTATAVRRPAVRSACTDTA